MDTAGVETVNIAAKGGADGAADQVIVRGTERRDVIKASGGAGSATVTTV